MLAVGARRLRLLSGGRPARLPLSAIDGGAQDAQDVVGPGLGRPVAFCLQPVLDGVPGLVKSTTIVSLVPSTFISMFCMCVVPLVSVAVVGSVPEQAAPRQSTRALTIW